MNKYAGRWVRTYGAPDDAYYDPGGANISDAMSEQLQLDSTTPHPCAGQAHWQIGVIEAHGKAAEIKFKRILDVVQPDSYAKWKRCLASCMS